MVTEFIEDRVLPGKCSLLAIFFFVLLTGAIAATAEETRLPDAPGPQAESYQPSSTQNDQTGYQKHHILWVIPNYRSDENPGEYEPLTSGQK